MNNIHFEQFTFEQFVERMHRPGRLCNEWSGTVGRAGWFGTNTFEEALGLLERGWPEGAAKLQRAAVSAIPDGDAFGFTPRFNHIGDEVAVDRYLEGEPECMIEWNLSRIQAPGRVATIVLNTTTSCSFSPEDYLSRGLAVLQLVDALESAGVRCEVRLAQASYKLLGVWVAMITIKEPDQPLDLDRLAFLLMHVSIYRRFVFRLLEQLPEPWFEAFSATGGTPTDIPAALIPANAIVVPKLRLGNESEIKSWIAATMARYLDTAQAA